MRTSAVSALVAAVDSRVISWREDSRIRNAFRGPSAPGLAKVVHAQRQDTASDPDRVQRIGLAHPPPVGSRLPVGFDDAVAAGGEGSGHASAVRAASGLQRCTTALRKATRGTTGVGAVE